jgi:uncharacterized sporulation protein YeaH/YhbH (DUF444 family)
MLEEHVQNKFMDIECRVPVPGNAPNNQVFSSRTYYLVQEALNNNYQYNRSLDSDSYCIYSFQLADGNRLASLNEYDMKAFIDEVTKLRKQFGELEQLETIKNYILNMSAESKRVFEDMIGIIRKEGADAVNKIRDLSSRADVITIDNKTIILDKDEDNG